MPRIGTAFNLVPASTIFERALGESTGHRMNCAHCDAVLTADARFCSRCGKATIAPDAPRESRRTVTILFMDLVESTALSARFDPEAMRQILNRYRWAARSCVEAHGGAMEKYIGDAVMAAFGAEVSHEDDALRAVRTA